MRALTALSLFLLACVLTAGAPIQATLEAESAMNAPAGSTNANVVTKPAPDKNTRNILHALSLADPAKEVMVHDILSAYFPILASWHRQNDPQLNSLWRRFNEARAAKDAPGAEAALASIENVYATFRPQHDRFLSELGALLSPEQIERVQDVLTVKKVEVTYNAYQAIFPILNAEQKAVVLKNLKAARAEAIDAGSMVEKSAFFKKYKIRIEEGYFATQGIDAQRYRREFAAKNKPSKREVNSDATTVSPGKEALRLWYTQPAAKWEEALPGGNGRLGAMVFGGTSDERIQFNEDTLWTGHPHDYVRAGSGEALPEVRRLLAEGKIKETETLARAKLLSDPVRQKAYQPFGDLRLHFPGREKTTNYRRELDLDSAVARTSYDANGITYTEEVFVSYPDNAIVARLTASKPGSISFSLRMDSPHKDSTTVQAPEPKGPRYETDVPLMQLPSLILSGRIQPDGLKFESRVRVFPTMGVTTTTEDSAITVEHADAVTLILVAATSFKNYEDISGDPAAGTQKMLAHFEEIHETDDKFYAVLLARHKSDHQNLFRRVSLRFDSPSFVAPTEAVASDSPPPKPTASTLIADLPTDERIRRAKTINGFNADPALATLEFQYGRYLLIASSRPGSQPANLQGIWNELLAPPWESKMTTNINLEMNYWPAELTNLSECATPLFDLIDDLTVSGARTARELYHSRGWVVHHNTDLWRGTAPINNIDGIWPTGGAWLCYHLWEHWLFTRDRGFLEHRAYPAMKAASLFFIDSLVRDAKTGWLVTSPSFSPEQGTLTAGPTMDNQLIRSLWQTTREAAVILGADADLAAQLEKLLPQLPPNQVGQHGQLQEWLDDLDKPNNNHRHMSPLWALYPGADITPADPKIYAAAKKLLAWRGDGSTGWSYAWRIPLWARVGDGEFAYRQLALLLGKRTLPNLFDLCGPFQIDGNFGATAGIAEMLLQSQQRTTDGKDTVIIDLLPALPKAWPAGSVTGLLARDGFEVDLAWANGKLTSVALRSKLGRPCLLRAAGHELALSTKPGAAYVLNGQLLAMH